VTVASRYRCANCGRRRCDCGADRLDPRLASTREEMDPLVLHELENWQLEVLIEIFDGWKLKEKQLKAVKKVLQERNKWQAGD